MDINSVLPGWEVVRKIGNGSFGDVYEIQRNIYGLSETAALKVIGIPQNGDEIDDLRAQGHTDFEITKHYERCLEQIIQEYSLMAQIRGHANVVNCEDVQVSHRQDGIGWDIYIKMELLHPLMKSLNQVNTEEQVVKLGQDICKALIRCKDRGIIHRDIKPQNIFVSDDGNFKLGDFGIAKTVERTTGGTRIGTYKYMAPEVYNNHPYGAAADVYSLGLVLYWLLNERRTPFLPMPPQIPTSSEEEQAGLRRFRGEAIPAPKYGSPELKRITLKACAYASVDRYTSASEMLADLQKLKNVSKLPLNAMPVVQQEHVLRQERVAQQGTVPINNVAETVLIQPQQQVQPKPKTEKPTKKKNEKVWLVIGVVAIIISVIRLAVFFMDKMPIDNDQDYGQDQIMQTEPTTTNDPTTNFSTTTPTTDSGMTTTQPTTATTMEPFFPVDDNPLGLQYEVNEDGRTCKLTSAGSFADTSLTLPSHVDGYKVTAVGDSAFKGSSITYLSIPDTVTMIGDYAFAECTGLLSVVIPGNVSVIGRYAFSDCTAMRSLSLSEGLGAIDEFAFYGCINLSSVKIPKSVSILGDDAFVGCYLLDEIQVDSASPYFTTYDGVVYNKAKTRLYYFPAGKTGTFRVPDSVTALGDYTFFKCSGITSVILPNGMTSIGYRTFYKCTALTSINIPDSVTEIDQYAFSGCESLESVTLPDGMTTISDFAFYECKNMTSLSIPASITSIGRSGISRCENLTSIEFRGTMAQWNAIEKGQNWRAYTGKYTIHCLDGDIEKT